MGGPTHGPCGANIWEPKQKGGTDGLTWGGLACSDQAVCMDKMQAELCSAKNGGEPDCVWDAEVELAMSPGSSGPEQPCCHGQGP